MKNVTDQKQAIFALKGYVRNVKKFFYVFKKSKGLLLACLLFLTCVFVMVPFSYSGSSANVVPAINSQLSLAIKNSSDDSLLPIGRVYSYSNQAYDYDYNDFPTDEVEVMENRFENVVSLKMYDGEFGSGLVSSFDSAYLNGKNAVVYASKLGWDDSFWGAGLFYPGVKMLAAQKSQRYPSNRTIYVNQSWADAFIENNKIASGSYESILGKEMHIISQTRFGTFVDYPFMIGGIIDPSSLLGTFIPNLFGNYFFVDWKAEFQAPSSLVFGISEPEYIRTRYLNKLYSEICYDRDTYNAKISYRLGFFESKDETYIYPDATKDVSSLNAFMQNCYLITGRLGNSWIYFLVFGCFLIASGLFFGVFYWRFLNRFFENNVATFDWRVLTKVNVFLLTFSLVCSIIILAIIGKYQLVGSYCVPLLSLPQTLPFCIVFFVSAIFLLLIFCLFKKRISTAA